MSDLIRREDVEKAIQSICKLCGEYKKNNGIMCGACNLDSFIREYEDIPSAEPERKWIPVSEALPKNSGHDWVLGQIRETDSGYLWIPKVVEYRESSDDWFEESIGWLKKNPDHAFEVIAWMPLPEPYKGE